MDRALEYNMTIGKLKKLPDTVQNRQIKYLNNVIKEDHGKLKKLIRSVYGFKILKTSYTSLLGFAYLKEGAGQTLITVTRHHERIAPLKD